MNRKERITLSPQSPSRKILLLHGDRQSGQLLLGRISSLKRKLLKPRSHDESDGITIDSSTLVDHRIEIVAPDGPFVWKLDPKIHLHESDKGNCNSSEENNLMRTWWYRDGDDHHGIVESLNMLHSLWLSDSGFEGILGFSRGARLAHYIALLNKATNGDYFKNLRYIISASGYGGYDLPTNFPNNVSMCQHLSKMDIENAMPLEIRSMHIMGISDNLVTVEASRALLPSYVDPVVYEHEGGHHIPMRAADVRGILKFIDSSSSCILNENRDIILMAKNNIIPDEEHAQLQIDECESLSLIFPEEFQLLSTTKNGDRGIIPGETLYNHPIIYSIQLNPPLQQLEEEDTAHLWPKSSIALKVQYTVDYPDTPPIFTLQHDMNLLEFKISQNDACLKAVERAAKAEEGMPCVMSCVYVGREFFEAGGLKSASTAVDEKEDFQNSNQLEESEADVDYDAGGDGILKSSTAERIEKCMAEGLEISYQIGGYKYVKNNTNAITNAEVIDKKDAISGKGGSWKFTIGLVGKPSAGKRYVRFIL